MTAAAHALSPTDRFHRFVFRFGHRSDTDGFEVRAMLPDRREREVIFGKVAAAVSLIAEHDRRRFAYLLRHLPRVWVVGLPAAIAQCHHNLGMCVLDFDYVTAESTSAGHLAQTLIHEGAHARLARAGFSYNEPARPRIERICVRQEAAFARRLPGATQLVGEAEERLQYRDELFSNRARRDRELVALRDLGRLGRLAYRIVTAIRRRAV